MVRTIPYLQFASCMWVSWLMNDAVKVIVTLEDTISLDCKVGSMFQGPS